MQRGAEALGWQVAPLARNVRDCVLSGYCIQGCRYDRKQSMLVTYLPWARQHGARIIADAPDRRSLHDDKGRATGALVATAAGELRFDARLVVLSAGAVQSPLLLQDSGLGGDQAGRHFACHPSLMVLARFDEPVNMWQGAQLGVYVDEFSRDERGGFLLEGGGLEPGAIAHAVPGAGADYEQRMRQAAQLAGMVTLIHDRSVGHIYRKDGNKTIDYRLADADRQRARAALICGRGPRGVSAHRIATGRDRREFRSRNRRAGFQSGTADVHRLSPAGDLSHGGRSGPQRDQLPGAASRHGQPGGRRCQRVSQLGAGQHADADLRCGGPFRAGGCGGPAALRPGLRIGDQRSLTWL